MALITKNSEQIIDFFYKCTGIALSNSNLIYSKTILMISKIGELTAENFSLVRTDTMLISWQGFNMNGFTIAKVYIYLI